LSWPCFFDSCRTCSLSKFQSPASLQIVTIPTRTRDVDWRSDAYCDMSARRELTAEKGNTWRAFFSRIRSFSIAAWTLVYKA
jgi:hypothetical protein